MSVGYSIFSRETDYDQINVSSFSTNSQGANVNWGYPISETSRIGFGFGFEGLDIQSGSYASSVIRDFISENGNQFDVFNLNLNWSKSTLNRGMFATRGQSQRLAINFAMPGSDMEYYKVTYRGQYLTGLTRTLSLKLRTDLGLGESYGDTTRLPFFKNFYGGGFGSVRGFERNSLGPQDIPCVGDDDACTTPSGYKPDPIGGNVKLSLVLK